MTITSYSDDSLIIEFPVTFPTTGPVTELGGVAEASADPAKGGPKVVASCTLSGNTVIATWPAGSFSAGTYIIQLKLSIAGQVQTVAEKMLTVRQSNN